MFLRKSYMYSFPFSLTISPTLSRSLLLFLNLSRSLSCYLPRFSVLSWSTHSLTLSAAHPRSIWSYLWFVWSGTNKIVFQVDYLGILLNFWKHLIFIRLILCRLFIPKCLQILGSWDNQREYNWLTWAWINQSKHQS